MLKTENGYIGSPRLNHEPRSLNLSSDVFFFFSFLLLGFAERWYPVHHIETFALINPRLFLELPT